MTTFRKLSCPVVSARTCLHSDEARWQTSYQLDKFVAPHIGTHECGLAGFIDAVEGVG